MSLLCELTLLGELGLSELLRVVLRLPVGSAVVGSDDWLAYDAHWSDCWNSVLVPVELLSSLSAAEAPDDYCGEHRQEESETSPNDE